MFSHVLFYFKTLAVLTCHLCVAKRCSLSYEFKAAETSKLPSREQIGSTKEWNGVRPIHYKIDLDFFIPGNLETYMGNVSLNFITTRRTRRLLFNYDVNSLNISPLYNINVTNEAQSMVCIQTVFLVKSEQTVIVEFEQALEEKTVYKLRLEAFNSTGTFYAGKYGITGTLLQTEEARKVFPCMDHPSLKATFTLCIKHESKLRVAFNVELRQQLHTDETGNIMQSCFYYTPVMSTYLLSFSLMDNPIIVTSRAEKPEITVYSSRNYPYDKSNENIMIFHSRKVINQMEQITQVKYPLKTLGYVNVPNYPVYGMENFGLINLQQVHSGNKAVLTHEIIHQWIGNLITVSHWGEVCLQESLTAFLTDLLLEETKLSDFKPVITVFQHRVSFIGPHIYTTDHIIRYCFKGAAKSVFAAIFLTKENKAEQILHKFIRILINRFYFSSFNILDFGQAMNEAFESPNPSKFFVSYFVKQEVPLLYLCWNKTDHSINIQYKVIVAGKSIRSLKPNESPLALPLKFNFRTFNNETIVFQNQNETLTSELTVYHIPPKINSINWFLLDAMGYVLGLRIYDAKTYYHFATYVLDILKNCEWRDDLYKRDDCFIGTGIEQNYIDVLLYNFCEYISEYNPIGSYSQFPHPLDNATPTEINETKAAMIELLKTKLGHFDVYICQQCCAIRVEKIYTGEWKSIL